MRTKAVRLYGKNDLRLEEFELPAITEHEILAKVISDSVCMSSHKAAIQGADHKRVPENIATNPTILGHEFCGELVEIGAKWQHQFKAGDRFAIQPALNYKGSLDAPGYSYQYIGGNATYIVIPREVMELGCLLTYKGEGFFYGSLAEPMSCIVGGFHASYHTQAGSYVHDMGIVEGGNMAMLAGAGPMGLGSIDYALHCDRKPKLLVVTDIDDTKLNRAATLFSPPEAAKCGVELVYKNTSDPAELLALTGGKGYDDVLVNVPVAAVVQLADRILGKDGCLNFFSGPTDQTFTAPFNFYNVHYASTHVVGVSGGNADDMLESLRLIEQKRINPAMMITHVGGMDSVIAAVLNLENIPGGKKLIYNHIDMPLTAIEDFGKSDSPLFKKLADVVKKNNGLWCVEAENVLLSEQS